VDAWSHLSDPATYDTSSQPLALGEVAAMFWLAIMGAKEQRLAATEHANI